MADRARPYPHQVGGHGQLAMTPAGHILKPSSEKENKFYSYIHSDRLPPHMRWIRSLTPMYYGQAEFPDMPELRSPASPVATRANSPSRAAAPALAPPTPPPLQPKDPISPLSNGPALTAPQPLTPTPANNSFDSNAGNFSASTQPQQRSQNSIHTPPEAHSNSNSTLHPAPALLVDHNRPPEPDASDNPVLRGLNLRWRTTDSAAEFPISPWAARMDSRWKKDAKDAARRARPSIALEDINRSFVLPCVMDCKIGIRHYDNDASQEKRRRHIMKANATTTAKCGVRYTGMQAFKREHRQDCHDGMFEVRDKYHGRTLREHDLVPEATWFFHDSFRVRTDCVRLILDKIRQLRRLLSAQHHFFFYSSSLLLVYEGALPETHPVRVDVRMIDFAHTVLSDGHRDDGYIFGIDYLIGILTQILENDRRGTTVLPPRIEPADSSSIPLHVQVDVAEGSSAGKEEDENNHEKNHLNPPDSGGGSPYDAAPVAEMAESPVS